MTAPLWTYHNLLEAASGKGRGGGDVYGIVSDSREAAPGDLFIALKGETSDGHDFVSKAFEGGASLALVSRTPKGLKDDDPRLVFVADTYQALLALAKAARKRSHAKIVAVTGTAGKTGAKDVLFDAFSMQGPAHKAVKSFNNHVGVPLSLARMPENARFAVFEVGMNAPGEIAPLSKLVRPHVALITTVGKGHFAAFENEEAIAKEKASIFAGLEPGGAAVLNAGNKHFALLKKEAKGHGATTILTFATDDAKADAHLDKCVMHDTCSCLTAAIGKTVVTCKVAMPGRHWVANALGILLAAEAAGGDLALASLALAGYQPQAGRGRIFDLTTERGAVRLIDESYNANPSSMRAALGVFAAMTPMGPRGRKIAVLGDMEELGQTAPAEHQALAGSIAAAGVEVLYVKGPGMEALLEALQENITGFAFSDNDGVCRKLSQDLTKGDVILVKGSRKAALDEVADHIRSMEVMETAEVWGMPRAAAE